MTRGKHAAGGGSPGRSCGVVRSSCVNDERVLPEAALEKSVGAIFPDRAAADKAVDALQASGLGKDRLRLTERSDSTVVNCVLGREESALWVIALLENLGGRTDGDEPQSPRAEDQASAPMGPLNSQHPAETLHDSIDPKADPSVRRSAAGSE